MEPVLSNIAQTPSVVAPFQLQEMDSGAMGTALVPGLINKELNWA